MTTLGNLADRRGPAAAWQRGWALTALGRFGDALEELQRATADGDPGVAAAAAITRGALYRQLGLHGLAGEQDAWVISLPGRSAEIVAAARIGLVADEVGGTADPVRLGALLDEARSAVGAGAWRRQEVRLSWVTGEVAMVTGAVADAVAAFHEALERSTRLSLRRHEAKSRAFLAAALGFAGDREAALTAGRTALSEARALGAAPVQWAAHLVLADLELPEHHRAQAARLLGATIDALAPDLAGLARERPPAVWLLA